MSSEMSRLSSFSTPDRLKELVGLITQRGKRGHCFENMGIQNICSWKLSHNVLTDATDIYGYPADNPMYIFNFEKSYLQFPQLYVRTPTQGHDCEILSEGIKEIVAVVFPAIRKFGKGLLLDSDTVVRATSGAFPFLETRSFDDYVPFCMDERQKQELLQMNATAPVGFKIDEIDVEHEFETIHAALFYADEAAPELTRLRLAHLPAVCIRNADGTLVSWEMTHHCGQLTHLFTVPPYRGNGVGQLAELLLAQKFAKSGLQVFKYVHADNENVLRGSEKHHLWTRCASTKDGNERSKGEEKIMWSFAIFSLVQ